MLTVISPAKRLDWNAVDHAQTEPVFTRESQRLAAHGRALTLTKLKGLMDLSDDLARLNRDRFAAFEDDPDPAHTRLEMGSRLKTRRGTNLYDFWGDEIAKALNEDAERIDSAYLVNCASQEYFGAVDLKRLKPRVVTPQFFEVKDGTPRMISFFAKKARGAMARFVVENDVTTLDGLKEFNWEGYRLHEASDDTLVFHRPAQSATKAA